MLAQESSALLRDHVIGMKKTDKGGRWSKGDGAREGHEEREEGELEASNGSKREED